MPSTVAFLVQRSSFFAPLQSIWNTLQRNSVARLWNLLLPASNATSSAHNNNISANAAADISSKEAVMHALDQFILSQHRSMKILQGGAVSFLEDQLLDTEAISGNDMRDPTPAADDAPATEQASSKRNNASLLMEEFLQNLTNATAAPGRRRRILQMDTSIRAYSSIVAATREYSRTAVGKSSVTDSWLQGPLQWPPR